MACSGWVRGVRQNRGGHGDSWGHVSGSWCRQAFVGKTEKYKRPLSGRLNKEKLEKIKIYKNL